MALKIIVVLIPIVLIATLMIWKQYPTHKCAVIGYVLLSLFAMIFFNTSLEVVIKSSIYGLVYSFPITLMVAFSVLQITHMDLTGCVKRIATFIKTMSPTDRGAQIMLLNFGAGTLLVALGATPNAILPPILLALGYSKYTSIALPCVGYDALCTYSMLGAPLIIFADLARVPLVEAAQIFSIYLPVVSTLVGFGMLYIGGRWAYIKMGWLPCVISGVTAGFTAIAMSFIPVLSSGVVLTGVVAGATVILIMVAYLKLLGKPILDPTKLDEKDLKINQEMSLAKALSTWIILLACLVIINFIPPLHDLVFRKWEFPIELFIPGAPIYTRVFFQAYTWLLISTIIAHFFTVKPEPGMGRKVIVTWVRRAWKAVLTCILFFGIAFVMMKSGTQIMADGSWEIVDKNNNMIHVVATATAAAVGGAYPFFSGLLGLFGGFITGSESSAIAFFGRYTIETSNLLNIDFRVVAACMAMGGGLASVISPLKLLQAAATIDSIGEETKVFRTAVGLSVVMVLIAGVVCTIFSYPLAPVISNIKYPI
ncbi:MAG: L-lactate permease [Bacillota bacterium]|jgi:lactate permease